MKNNNPSEIQKEIIKEIINEFSGWISTNDIKSPSHYHSMEETVRSIMEKSGLLNSPSNFQFDFDTYYECFHKLFRLVANCNEKNS